MSDAEQRDIAEALFEPKQTRDEIKDAIKTGGSEACGYGQKPIPSEELAPIAQPSQHAVREIAPLVRNSSSSAMFAAIRHA